MDDRKLRERIKEILREKIAMTNQYGGKYDKKLYKRLKRDMRAGYVYESRHKAGIKAAKKNPWVKFLKKWMKEHPNIRGKEAMEQASRDYR